MARLVRRLTAATQAPCDSHVVVQREAARRFVGPTLLANSVKLFEPTIVHQFKRADFAPPPRVDMVFLR